MTSYVYVSVRRRKFAVNLIRDPTLSGPGLSCSADRMLTYHSGALTGSAEYCATSERGRWMSVTVETSTSISGLARVWRSFRSRRFNHGPRLKMQQPPHAWQLQIHPVSGTFTTVSWGPAIKPPHLPQFRHNFLTNL